MYNEIWISLSVIEREKCSITMNIKKLNHITEIFITKYLWGTFIRKLINEILKFDARACSDFYGEFQSIF